MGTGPGFTDGVRVRFGWWLVSVDIGVSCGLYQKSDILSGESRDWFIYSSHAKVLVESETTPENTIFALLHLNHHNFLAVLACQKSLNAPCLQHN